MYNDAWSGADFSATVCIIEYQPLLGEDPKRKRTDAAFFYETCLQTPGKVKGKKEKLLP